jgi:hypothetical protein
MENQLIEFFNKYSNESSYLHKYWAHCGILLYLILSSTWLAFNAPDPKNPKTEIPNDIEDL